MLDVANIDTIKAFRLLLDEIATRNKPLLFWIGAGPSNWCGYDLWPELARKFHRHFLMYSNGYDKDKALKQLQSENYMQLFQLCRNTDRQAYYRFLARCFDAKESTPLYKRFIDALNDIQPLSILTTNIDRLLESNIGNTELVERSDIERALNLFNRHQSFILKLHGSVSAIESTIFTTEDYEGLFADNSHISLMSQLLASATILFIGYSIRDSYLFKIIKKNADLKKVFGDGPHFAVLSSDNEELPESVRIIKYIPEPHRDHRSFISILEEVRYVHKQPSQHELSKSQLFPHTPRSAHLLFDVFPPGTWKTSYLLNVTSEIGGEEQIVVGNGFTNQEFSEIKSSAMHDIIVSLLCFDTVYAPITALARTHDLIGSQIFWELVSNDILRFISWASHAAIRFPSPTSASGGQLQSISVYDPDMRKQTVGDVIRKHLVPATRHERKAEALFDLLESKTREIALSEEGSIREIVHALVLRRSINRSLGLSEVTPFDSLARWQMWSVLRLANIVKLGTACRILGISSLKLDFGAAGLAGPALGTVMGANWTDDVASYITCGRFDTVIGNSAINDPAILQAVLVFRDTNEGQKLREEIFAALQKNQGGEVSVAINAGLSRTISYSILQEARDQFVNLLVSNISAPFALPAMWNDPLNSEKGLALWRKRSLATLREYCDKMHIQEYDLCPCGSGEKLKYCCYEALKT